MASLIELAFPEIEYPESDGQPIGETEAKIIELQQELEKICRKKS